MKSHTRLGPTGPLSWELRSLLLNYGHHRSQAKACRTKSWIQERTLRYGVDRRKKAIRESFLSLNGSVTDTLSDFEQLFRVGAGPFADFLKGDRVERGQLLGHL